jgi:hypothetical protein
VYSKIKIAGHPVHAMLVAFPVACYTGTLGFLGWTLVQDYHVGVHLVPEQELAEPTVQHHHLSLLHRHAA